MRAVLQRVRWAEVELAGESGLEPPAAMRRIGPGLLVYVGVGVGDEPAHAEKLAEKVAYVRVFPDERGKMNLSVRDVGGGVLVIPNFTLLADARKGRRPAFAGAAPAAEAEPVHEAFVMAIRRSVANVAAGVFGAHMIVRSAADGPVNILIELPDPAAT